MVCMNNLACGVNLMEKLQENWLSISDLAQETGSFSTFYMRYLKTLISLWIRHSHKFLGQPFEMLLFQTSPTWLVSDFGRTSILKCLLYSNFIDRFKIKLSFYRHKLLTNRNNNHNNNPKKNVHIPAQYDVILSLHQKATDSAVGWFQFLALFSVYFFGFFCWLLLLLVLPILYWLFFS